MILEEIISQVLDIDAQRLTDDSNPVTIPQWNSLKHIELIVAIETAYNIRFARPEIASLRSVGDIRALLSRKGITQATDQAAR